MNCKRHGALLVFALLCSVILSSCGYYNPNMLPEEEAGPAIRLYVPLWTNPTSETRLAPDIHNSLQDWLIQSKRITLANNQDSADYVLSGKILAVHYPGRSYDVTDTAQALKAILTVEYTVTETATGRIVWQAKSYSLEETYSLGSSTSQTDSNKKAALAKMVEDLGEHIYIRIYRAITRAQKGAHKVKK